MVGRNADFIAAESVADDEGVDEHAFGNAEVVVVVVVDFDKEMSPVEMQNDSGAAYQTTMDEICVFVIHVMSFEIVPASLCTHRRFCTTRSANS